MSIPSTEYITKGELDVRMNFSDQMTETQITSMKELFDEKLGRMEAIIERGLSEHRAIAHEMKAEVNALKADINDVRGDVKALNAQVYTLQTRFGWYLTLFSVGVGIVLVLFQLFAR